MPCKTKVAIIGVGPSGLAVIRNLKDDPNLEIRAFERSDRVGGIWVQNDKYKASPVYDHLVTNFPKEILGFPDFPFDSSLPSFISHRDMLAYIESYTKHFELLQYVQFRTSVVNVTPVKKGPNQNVPPKWLVSLRKEPDQVAYTSTFDAVIICNGHFNVPHYPDVPGLSDFQGTILHSHSYTNCEGFAGKSVAVIGRGQSGLDIVMEIATCAKKVYLSDNRPCKLPTSSIGNTIEQVDQIKQVNANSVTLVTNTELETDVLIFCTGYRYHFPFLSSSCHPQISEGCIHGLYKHMISVNHPTLAFLGLVQEIAGFSAFYAQAIFFKAVLTGQVLLPNAQLMLEDEAKDLAYRTAIIGWPARYAHRMDHLQWAYMKNLHYISRTEYNIPSVCEKIYDYFCRLHSKKILTFRRARVIVLNEDEFSVVLS